MKRLRRIMSAESTTKQDQLAEMISQLDDDFSYALSGLEKLSRSGNTDIESGIAIATELSGNIQDIIAQISDLFTGSYSADVEESTNINADTVKKKNGKWVNRGDTGEEHGEFSTKKEADAQRKAMYARGFKG